MVIIERGKTVCPGPPNNQPQSTALQYGISYFLAVTVPIGGLLVAPRDPPRFLGLTLIESIHISTRLSYLGHRPCGCGSSFGVNTTPT